MLQSKGRNQQFVKKPENQNGSIEWILNLLEVFPRQELMLNNLLPIPEHAQLKLQESEPGLQAMVYSFNTRVGKFQKTRFQLYANMLVRLPMPEQDDLTQINKPNTLSKSEYLILSACLLHKKCIQYKEFFVQGVILSSNTGECYLFFDNQVQCMEWYQSLKQFCKMTDFLQKFTIKDKLQVANVFTCIKNKNSRLFTVQIYKQFDLIKHPALTEALMNEVNILMSFKHPALLNYLRLYEDQNHLYILYDYWNGEPLFKYSKQEVANIIIQIVKLVKHLHANKLYHGSITPSSIIVMGNNNSFENKEMKAVLMSFAYRDQNSQNWLWLKKKLPRAWQPPELLESHPQNIDPQKIDVYQIGCCLYYMINYQAPKQLVEFNFLKSVQNFTINHSQLSKQLQIRMNGTQGDIYQGELSSNLLDLLNGLLHPDPKIRFDITDILKHSWFVSQKTKVPKVAKGNFLPSLKTILELREQSSFDMSSYRRLTVGKKDEILISIDSENEQVDEDGYDQIHRFTRENCTIFYHMNHLQSIGRIKRPKTIQSPRLIKLY